MVGDVTVPGSYLHSAFVVHSGSSEDDVWIADSGASCHMTHDRTRILDSVALAIRSLMDRCVTIVSLTLVLK